MIYRWWDNLMESCDMRLLVGAGTLSCWLLLLVASPVFSSVSTLILKGLSWRVITLVSAGLFLLTAFMISRRLTVSIRYQSTLITIGGFASFLGVLAHRFTEGLVLEAASAVAVGFGIVSLCLLWSRPFASIKLRKRVVGTAASGIFGCIAYLLIVATPQPFALFLGACLPLVSTAHWIMLEASPAPTNNNTENDTDALTENESLAARIEYPHENIPKPVNPFGRPLSIATVIYGTLFVLCGHVLPEREPAWTSTIIPGVEGVAAFLMLEIILSVYMVKRVQHENPVVAYRPATILVGATFLLLPFSSEEASLTCIAIAFAGFGSFVVYLWIVMGNICQKQQLSHFRVFSQGMLMLALGFALGEIGTASLLLFKQGGFDYVATLCVIALFLLVVIAWQMSDGSLTANETKEMGGEFFDRTDDQVSEGSKTAKAIEQYRLSPREAEVLALLLKGRSIPYICDELFVAKSTVQTHVRHIYAKMEITEGRQQLIDRIESLS